jgi:hypothetical protein
VEALIRERSINWLGKLWSKKKIGEGLVMGLSWQKKNKALLFKWIWKLGCDDKASADLIRKKYKPSFSNGLPQFSKRL